MLSRGANPRTSDGVPPIPEPEDATVTVVIPYSETYTPRELLDEAVESAESQAAVDTEVLVIEDEQERGPAWARNVGLDRADSRFVAFLDADDTRHERSLARQLHEMRRTGAGLCVEGDWDDTTMGFVGGILTDEIWGLTSSILVDREQTDVRFDESLNRREDHLFMIQAAAQAGVCSVPDLFTVRDLEQGLSNHVDTTPAEIDEFFELVVEACPSAHQFRRAYYQRSYVYLGRLRHEDGQYVAALRYFVRSLEYGPNVLATGAIGLTLLRALYEYSLRSVRHLRTRGTPD